MFIDSHAHLEGKRYDTDRDEVLARAKQNGIEAYLAIGNGDGPDTADCGIRLAEKYDGKPEYPRIWASVGVHPHEASLANEAADSQMLQWARHPKVIAWGEIGLDYYYDHSPREMQKAVFLQQMELAQDGKAAHHHSLPPLRQQRKRMGRLPGADRRTLGLQRTWAAFCTASPEASSMRGARWIWVS